MAVIDDQHRSSNLPSAVTKPGNTKSIETSVALHALTSAALFLPGLVVPQVRAAEGDVVDFQYSHYQEGKRSISVLGANSGAQENGKNNNPIEVDSLHGHANVSLTDRIKFAFNYNQDTWGGATPISTVPSALTSNRQFTLSDNATIGGASPLIQTPDGLTTTFIDKKFKIYKQDIFTEQLAKDSQLTHVMSTASPEVRKQGDFRLSYEWDEAAVSVGGGVSVEDDYESRFGNIGGRMDFNQKQTTVNADLSYTNSENNAILDHDAVPYIAKDRYFYDTVNNPASRNPRAEPPNIIDGKRQDWGTHLGISQVLNKDAVVSADFSYSRSTGYLSNPYKLTSVLFVDPAGFADAEFITPGLGAFLERRPEVRNQWGVGGRYVQYIKPFDAALHFDYRFSADDWGIHSHTFEADWVQPLADGWTLTPRVRYYSQDAADFYAPYLLINGAAKTQAERIDGKRVPVIQNKLPEHFSSDHRLSGFGALSGGLTVTKKFTKGLSLESSFEYYTHQGSFKLGGGGEGAFADFDYWIANAALKVDLEALSVGGGGIVGQHGGHAHHSHHAAHAPAGVMFDHMLPKAGDMMVGYRYMYGSQGAPMLNGDQAVNDAAIVGRGCGPNPCFVTPASMNMTMHMLDLMYAPTDWLTLMLMPQFMDMSMSMRRLQGAPPDDRADNNIGNPVIPGGGRLGIGEHVTHHVQNGHETGGIGDLGMYALFKLFDDGTHHLHVTGGLTAPTGDVDIKLRRNHGVDGGYIHYGMQLGSGTWDFKPSLTYTGHLDEFSWGAQANATVRMEDSNESGYALGDIFQATAWGNYNLTDWLTASIRGVYTLQGSIKGKFNGLINQFGPMDYPGSYGGKFWDIGFGLSAVVPTGDLAGNRLSVEWLHPVKDDVNGYQLERDGTLSATWSVAF